MAGYLDLSEGHDVKHISDHYLSIINKLEYNSKQNVELTDDILDDEIKETEELVLLEMAEDLCDTFVSLQEQKQKLADVRKELQTKFVGVPEKYMDNVINETKSKIYKFKEAYKNCEIYLDGILQKDEKEQNVVIEERHGERECGTFFSISDKDLASYISCLDSSRKNYNEFEIYSKVELISRPVTLYPYNTVISAINLAAVACEELTTIAFKLLNLD